MKKKFFITENQYKRIFLKEVGSNDPKPLWNPHIRMWTHPAYSDYEFNVPKNMIYRKNSNGTFSPAYPESTEVRLGSSISKDDPDIIKKTMELEDEKFFKKHIKNKSDSDAFRLWVNDIEFPDRIKKVNATLKSNGLKGTLDPKSSAPYDNSYMKVAFKSIGRFYIVDKNNKNKEESSDKFLTPTIKESSVYQNYLNSIKSWDSSYKTFGWTNLKTTSSEKIQDILTGKVSVSTCINPSYILKQMEILWNNMYKELSNKNTGVDIDSIMGRISWDSDLNQVYPTIDDGKKQYNPLDKLSDENPVLAKTLSGFQVDKEMDNFWNKVGTQFKTLLEDYNTYKLVLDQIDVHNITIINQTPEKLENACENPVYNIKTLNVGYSAPGSGGSSGAVNETFTWKQACSKNGGVFMYPSTPVSEEGGTKKIGIIGGKVTCCCVNPKGTADVIVDGLDGKYNAKINIEEWCKKSQGDVRSGLDKFAQWGGECASDWHCIADIASIAVLALGPGGILLSGIIDTVSAVGYVVEQDEGWKLNAGLTILGAFGGVGEAFGLLKQGSKFTSKLSTLTKELKLVSGDPILSRRILRDFAKTLSPEEAKQFKNFGKVATSEEVISKFGKGGEFTNEFNKLSKIQKGVFSNMLKKESPENLEKLFKNSGNDINKMVDGYVKGTKQVILQGGLFAGMYVYSENLAKGLKNLYDTTGFDPLGIFGKDGNIDSEKLSPDYSRIIGSKEQIDSFGDQLTKSGYIDQKAFKGETDLLYSFYMNVKEILKISNKSLETSVLSLKSEVSFQINGKRYKHKDIKEVIDLVNPILKGILNKTYSEKEGVDLINQKIGVLKTMTKPNISKEEKTAVIVTGNTDLTPEEISDFQNMLMTPSIIKNQEGDSNNDNLDNDKDMKLNEQITRIKSLFTDERLYGNLVNEVCDNEADAVKFLKDKGYIVRQGDEADLCLGPNTEIGKVYNKYKSDAKLSFQSSSSTDGCYLGIYRKDKTSRENHFFLINLFEQGLNEKNRFNMYYMLNDNAACEKIITIGSSEYKMIITKDGYDSSTDEFGVGLRYIKMEGFWRNVSGTIELFDTIMVKLMDKDKKAIKTNIKAGVVNLDLSNLTGLNDQNGGTSETLKNSSGTCVTFIDFLNDKLGTSLNSVLMLDDMIENQIKV